MKKNQVKKGSNERGMTNKKSLFPKVVLLIFIFLLLNISFILYKNGILNRETNIITGHSIKDIINRALNLSSTEKIFLISEALLFIIVLFFIFFRNRKLKSKEEIKNINLKKVSSNTKTDLDTLYNILKEKKQIKISSIVEIFKIKNDVAEEWGNILESADLAIIEYPGIGGPILKLVENEKENKTKENT